MKIQLASNQHIAILLKEDFQLNLKSAIDILTNSEIHYFNQEALTELLEEEAKWDKTIAFAKPGQTLRSMSSGERKVALFKQIASLKPKYLCIERLYENLDIANQSILLKAIDDISAKCTIIQLVRKEDELLPFIRAIYSVNEKLTLIPYMDEVAVFFASKTIISSEFKIPNAPNDYIKKYDTFIEFKDVSLSYLEKPILNNINWKVSQGDFWHLKGENGSGKSTILSLITGDNPKAYGQHIVLFDKLKGTEYDLWEIKQKIGYFTPSIAELLNKGQSVINMVLSGYYDSVGLYIKPSDFERRLSLEWLALVGKAHLATKSFSTLSLADQRLVLIIRAMVKHPPLLILDEPISGIAQDQIALIVALINKFAKETKTTIIYVSHTQDNGIDPSHVYMLEKSNQGSKGTVVFLKSDKII